MSNLTADTLLSRKHTAEKLTENGYPIADATLRTMACRGGGPAYRRFGRVAVYRWGDALAWAEARMTPPRRSTSEAGARNAA